MIYPDSYLLQKYSIALSLFNFVSKKGISKFFSLFIFILPIDFDRTMNWTLTCDSKGIHSWSGL